MTRKSRARWLHRRLDRSIGIPLVVCCGLLRRWRALPQAPARIGLIQPTAIGDMILSSGVVLRLREVFPHAQLHLFHGANNREAAGLLRAEVVAHQIDLLRPWAAVSALRRYQVDLLIDLCPWPRTTALVAAAAGAVCTVGFASERQHRHHLFDIAVEHSCGRHETANLAQLAALFGPPAPYRIALGSDLPRPSAADALRGVVVFHPGAGGAVAAAKAWPADHWAVVAAAVTTAGYQVVLTGSAAERLMIGEIVAQARRLGADCISLAGRLSLAEVGHVLQHCRLLVTVDNGVMHLGAALGCALVALHGPTRAARWGPVSDRAIALDSPHPAAGYSRFGFEPPRAADEVMAAISVATVWDAVRRQFREPADMAASLTGSRAAGQRSAPLFVP